MLAKSNSLTGWKKYCLMMTKIHNKSIIFAAVGLKLACGAILLSWFRRPERTFSMIIGFHWRECMGTRAMIWLLMGSSLITKICKADRTMWKLTLQDINTIPKEPKTERGRCRRQLFRRFLSFLRCDCSLHNQHSSVSSQVLFDSNF